MIRRGGKRAHSAPGRPLGAPGIQRPLAADRRPDLSLKTATAAGESHRVPSSGPEGARPTNHKALSLMLFLGILLVGVTFLYATLPVGEIEEHFEIGQRLRETGSLAGPGDPGLLRAPGYPALVAGVLLARDAGAAVLASLGAATTGAATTPADDRRAGDERAVQLAQSLLFSGAAVLLFWFAGRHHRPLEAACVAVVFALNPLSLIIAGALTYPPLHVPLIAVATAYLGYWLDGAGAGKRRAVLAGALWGLTTLVRPVSLILPFFVVVLLAVKHRWQWRVVAGGVALFTLGMLLPIGPYAIRNYVRSGRLVLVTSQGSFAVWGSTVEKLRPGEKYLLWTALWRREGMPIYTRVTGSSEFSLEEFDAHISELSDRFTRETWRNIRTHPEVYLHNVTRNLWWFNVDLMDYWLVFFQRKNAGGSASEPMSLPPRARWSGSATRVWVAGLALLGLIGVAAGMRNRDLGAWAVALVYVMFCLAHSLTFMGPRYTYLKLPVLVVAFEVLLRPLGRWKVRLPGTGTRLRASALLAVAVAAFCLVCTVGIAG